MSNDGFHDILEDPLHVLCHELVTGRHINPSVGNLLLEHVPDDRGVENVGQLPVWLLRLILVVHSEVPPNRLREIFYCRSSFRGI